MCFGYLGRITMNRGGTEVGIQLYRMQVKLQNVSVARAGCLIQEVLSSTSVTGSSSIYSV